MGNGLLGQTGELARAQCRSDQPASDVAMSLAHWSSDATIPQALALLNGAFLNRAVRMHRTHLVRGWLSSGLSSDQVVTNLFLQTVGRKPTAPELQWARDIATSEAGWSDLHWALVNTREFMFIR